MNSFYESGAQAALQKFGAEAPWEKNAPPSGEKKTSALEKYAAGERQLRRWLDAAEGVDPKYLASLPSDHPLRHFVQLAKQERAEAIKSIQDAQSGHPRGVAETVARDVGFPTIDPYNRESSFSNSLREHRAINKTRTALDAYHAGTLTPDQKDHLLSAYLDAKYLALPSDHPAHGYTFKATPEEIEETINLRRKQLAKTMLPQINENPETATRLIRERASGRHKPGQLVSFEPRDMAVRGGDPRTAPRSVQNVSSVAGVDPKNIMYRGNSQKNVLYAPGTPLWYSGSPAISGDYAHFGGGTSGDLSAYTVPRKARYTPHIATDTSAYTSDSRLPAEIQQKIQVARRLGGRARMRPFSGSWPYYETVQPAGHPEIEEIARYKKIGPYQFMQTRGERNPLARSYMRLPETNREQSRNFQDLWNRVIARHPTPTDARGRPLPVDDALRAARQRYLARIKR